eukprot:1206748-Ditylum_brightwellii.AAC.1
MDTHTQECTAIAQYIVPSKDSLNKLICYTPLPIQQYIMKVASSPNAQDNQQTNDWYHCELVKMKLYGQFFVQQTPQGQDKNKTLHCHRTNIGNKQQEVIDLQARLLPALLCMSTER